jgi:hypothetical protein
MKYSDIMKNQTGDLNVIEEDIGDKTDGFIQRKVHIIGFEYFLNFDDTIVGPSEYRRAYEVLREAKRGDVIKLILNTEGGWVRSFIQLYSSLMRTEATTVAQIHEACSAGALLALSCDYIDTQEFCLMMFHDMSSGGYYGKLGEVEPDLMFSKKRRKEFENILYKGFLTDKEIEKIRDGKDIYLDKKNIDKRLKKWIPIRGREE